MFCDYIKVAVSNILSDPKNSLERCCGSCNPSCDDLTRFICFGHSIEEINEWINKNPDLLAAEMQKQEEKMDADYFAYMQKKSESSKVDFAKSFCAECPIFIATKDKVLAEHNSVFDAVMEVEAFQETCIATCGKFKEAFAKQDQQMKEV